MLLPGKRTTSALDAWARNVRPLATRRPAIPRGRPVFDDDSIAPGPRRPYSPEVGPIAPAPVRPLAPAAVSPMVQSATSLDPFLAALARDRAAKRSRLQSGWSGFTADLTGALAALAAPIGGIYDRAESSARASSEAVANRLGISGEAAQADLGSKMAQINAPGTAAADLGGIYKGAAGSGYAIGMSEADRLNAEGAAAELYASKLPAIGALEGARIMAQQMQALEDDYRSQETNYIKEKAQQDREEARYREEVAREEKQRREDRYYEEKQARLAARQREKEFMLTLMADQTEAQRKAAEKRLEREWEKQDNAIKRQHDYEMAMLSNANISSRQSVTQAAQIANREDQQAFQAGENAKARAAAAKKAAQKKNEGPTSIAQWMVEDARKAVVRTNSQNQVLWQPQVARLLRTSPEQADGIVNGAINSSLRSSGINPKSAQGKAIRQRILKSIRGKTFVDSKGNTREYQPRIKK